MSQTIAISGVHMEVDDDLRKYVRRKIGGLDQYVPRRARPSMHTDIKLKDAKAKDKREWTCEVIMHLPHETLEVSESAINMYAAIDIAEAKLRAQLHKYKELHAGPRLHRRLLARLKQGVA